MLNFPQNSSIFLENPSSSAICLLQDENLLNVYSVYPLYYGTGSFLLRLSSAMGTLGNPLTITYPAG